MELIRSNNADNDKYEEYEMLLLERDQAQKEAGQIWTAYQKEFGQMIAEIYEVKLDCIKYKKTIAYYQRAINHGGVVDADAMQEYLDREMEVYYANLKRMLDDNARCRDAKSSTAYEVQRSKTLYRRLAKILHPDINPATDQYDELMELWNRIVYAYGHNDVKALAELEVLTHKALADIGLDKVKVFIPKIDDRIAELRDEIIMIHTTEPYIYGELLKDEEAVERKKKELADEMREYKEYREQLKKAVDDILAGGRITLKWHMD